MRALFYILVSYLLLKMLTKKQPSISGKMKTSENGVREIISHEGKRYKAYKDTKGLWTTGVGHLIKLPAETWLLTATLTDKHVSDLLIEDLKQAENVVNGLGVPLTQNQFDALVSIAFNVGGRNFLKSELAKELKRKDYKRAAELIVEKGYHPERRKREQKLFLA